MKRLTREDFQVMVDTMTISEVSRSLGVSEATVYRLIRENEITRNIDNPKGGRGPKVVIEKCQAGQ